MPKPIKTDTKYICIHGHFYQPPRENPWLEEIEEESSAYPFQNWNERIATECYAPNTSARILNNKNKILEMKNNYANINFNIGPTLMPWLQSHKPQVYDSILSADQLSKEQFSGHGSAIAQVYNHIIMPLANKRDKNTQVYWGIYDFVSRFNRYPEGMWLAETAVDTETLEVLADHNIKYTILAPHQAKQIKKEGSNDWVSVNENTLDTKSAYEVQLPSGKTIAVFFYDRSIAHGVAFGNLLNNGQNFADSLKNSFRDDDSVQLVHFAVDGETFGHHHSFGEMALSYTLDHIENKTNIKLTNYGEFLAKFPPTAQAQIVENSSWSCSHGIERWRSNCGCDSGQHYSWHQAWRKPLRNSLNLLRDQLSAIYETEAAKVFKDPWEVRNEYIKLQINHCEESVKLFIENQRLKENAKYNIKKVLSWLEMQKYSLFMFTSCAWFFDDISGIESRQILKYAARALQLVEPQNQARIEKDFLNGLADADSNNPNIKNGAEIYLVDINREKLTSIKVGLHYAISRVFEINSEPVQIYSYQFQSEFHSKLESEFMIFISGRVHLTTASTLEENTISYAVFYLKNHHLNGACSELFSIEEFREIDLKLQKAFNTNNMKELFTLIQTHFELHTKSIDFLFRKEQKKALKRFLSPSLNKIEKVYNEIYSENIEALEFLEKVASPIPSPMMSVAKMVLSEKIKTNLKEIDSDVEELSKYLEEAHRLTIDLNFKKIKQIATVKVSLLVQHLREQPYNTEQLQLLKETIIVLKNTPMELDLWEAQSLFFNFAPSIYLDQKKAASNNDIEAANWIKEYFSLREVLQIAVTF